jgi:AcrR family transcriptional regulator
LSELTSRKRRSDGERSRATILTAAVEAASLHGFQALTIGALAVRTGLSKSGLFAHFGSKEGLQLATLGEAWRVFEREVFAAAARAPAGVARLVAVTESYLAYLHRPEFGGGRLFVTIAADQGQLSAAVRQSVARFERRLFLRLVRLVREAESSGELPHGTDARQMAFEILAALAAADHWSRLAPEAGGPAHARRAIEQILLRAAQPG